MSALSPFKTSLGTRTAFVLATALTIGRPVTGLAQQLQFSAEVGQTEFFEGEPIYLLVRLQNVSTDTAWVTCFALGTLPFTLSVSRGDGNPVPVRMPYLDCVVPPTWRGDPVAPGASVVNTLVLQDLTGEWDFRSHLFLLHLSPDQYRVHVEFAAHEGVPRTTPLLLKAAPVSFRIRERTARERAEVAELDSIRQIRWDTTS